MEVSDEDIRLIKAYASKKVSLLPIRVDEMTEREYKIFEVAAEACGLLNNIDEIAARWPC